MYLIKTEKSKQKSKIGQLPIFDLVTRVILNHHH